MALVAAVNLRGVGESVKANVVLTLVELSGLLLVILVGVWAIIQGDARLQPGHGVRDAEDKSVFLAVTTATSLAFFAMVGFEDSVNMAEETKDPVGIFPKVMLTGLGITGVIYVLVVDLRGGDRAGRRAGRGRATRRCSRSSRPAHPTCRSATSSRSSRCSRWPTRR